MDIDFKTISVVVGIASTSLGILYRVTPKRSDRIKKNLELLKLAKETEANHLPLLRHVNTIIHNEYVHEEVSLKERFGIRIKHVAFAAMLSIAFLGLLGVIVSSVAQAAFGLTDETAQKILAVFITFGVASGLFGGLPEADKELEEIKNAVDERIRNTVEADEKALKGEEKGEIILNASREKENGGA